MEYDHIFDVDLGDGIMRKLPYNNGGNPHEAADKFVIREGLSKMMVEQIVAFLKKNALGYKTKEDHERRKPGQEAPASLGGEVSQKKSIIPMKTTLYFDQIPALDKLKAKLHEFNAQTNTLDEN